MFLSHPRTQEQAESLEFRVRGKSRVPPSDFTDPWPGEAANDELADGRSVGGGSANARINSARKIHTEQFNDSPFRPVSWEDI